MSTCNGFKLKGLNQASGRISVKSNVQSTWMLTYRRPGKKEAISHEVAIAKNELIILKCEDGADSAEVEIVPLGDRAGTLVVESSRAHVGKKTRTLRVGSVYRWELDPGEALICHSVDIEHPTHAGAGLAV